MGNDYYTILGVPRDASLAAIRNRFRQLARERHPDRFRGEEKERAEEEFQSITEAFNVLMNPELRRRFDEEQAASRRNGNNRHVDQAQLAKVYLQRGVQAYKGKKYHQAADNFDRATQAAPDSAKAWYSLALACSRERRYEARARAAIRKACELAPMNETYLRAAGRIFAAAGNVNRAVEYYEEALKWSADDPAIRKELEELRSSQKGRFSLFGKS